MIPRLKLSASAKLMLLSSSQFATTLTVSGLRDTTANNATFVTNNGHTYINDNTNARTQLYRALSADFGVTVRAGTTFQPANTPITINQLLNLDDDGTSTRGDFDVTYRWDNSANGFVRN